MPSPTIQQLHDGSDQEQCNDHDPGQVDRRKQERKLPVQQLAILAVCRLAEPIASTSVFPYLPEMVESFGVPQDQIAKWAGLCASTFAICQAIMGIPWGRASDRFGRKLAILAGLTTTFFTSLLWGFSTSLPMAIFARAIAGAGNGNVGIIRTTVAEMVPYKELQPRAFSLMPLVWNVGSIFGPTIGGALSNPLRVEPPQKRGTEGYASFLARYPYAVPNIVAACFFLIGITTGALFLHETLETKRNSRDYGIVLGKTIARKCRLLARQTSKTLHLSSKEQNDTDDSRQDEISPLIKHQNSNDQEAGLPIKSKPARPPPGFREVITKQSALNLFAYALLAMHIMTYDQLLPVFMHHPPLCSTMPRQHNCVPAFDSPNFLKFPAGFGLKNQQIGLLLTMYGAIGMLAQFFIFPPVARRYGILFCLKVCAIILPITYFVTPFTALLPTRKAQMGVNFVIMVAKEMCAIFAFPCSTILLTNTASSLRVLGTLNGFATSVSAIGRGLGPAIGGATFTLGVQKGYVIAPWWLLSGIGFIAAIPVFFLIEGEGFGGDDGEISVDDDDGKSSSTGASRDREGDGSHISSGAPPSLAQPSNAEENYGTVGPIHILNRISTASSEAFDEDEENGVVGTIEAPKLRKHSSHRRQSLTSNRIPVSQPIGMGSGGISRRYSSNLGASLGSAGSFHGQ
ncbi:MFS general substrate transporter [Polychaeton citri CBS 116435]|uniref:MFS general substrate transporter n=1 Tax=Polychaeton citri CBS 116435 TaxID=1314669 RepID=A0A9P4UHU7_9PEZI|nr:MFS general substrate transporter [Polychaeton citri CBS 116435]